MLSRSAADLHCDCNQHLCVASESELCFVMTVWEKRTDEHNVLTVSAKPAVTCFFFFVCFFVLSARSTSHLYRKCRVEVFTVFLCVHSFPLSLRDV